MSNYSQYNSKFNGTSWESMMQLLLLFEDSENIAYSRPGRDNGIDAVSGDGLTVSQAKFHEQCSIDNCIADLKSEMSKIKDYKEKIDYWKPVKRWVLFTNVEENPNDREKWKNAVESCDTCGLDVDLWDWPKVWILLEKYPEVKQEFIENESRCFLLKKEFQELCRKQYLPESFDVDCVGRDKELLLFKNFMESEKQIWSFSGPGGMGKSRFLIECANTIDEKKWNVYFGVSEVLKTVSAWNKRVVLDRSSVLFIDELNDVDLLKRILTDLDVGTMKRCKVVFSERNINAKTILELKLPKYDSIRLDSVVLSRLNNDNRIKLTSALLQTVRKKRNVQFYDIDRAVHNISEVSQGIPLWISLAVKIVLKQNGSLGAEFDEKAEVIFKEYSNLIRPSLQEIPLSNEKYDLVLKWTALYKQISLLHEDVVNFICLKTDVDQVVLQKTYQLMTDVGLMQRFGFKDNVFSICPDVIRESILKDNLIFNHKLSSWGKDVVTELISGNVPQVENVVESLSRIEISCEDDVNVLGEFIESIGRKFDSNSIETHDKIWSVLERVSFNWTEKVLEIVNMQLNTYRSLKDVDKYVFNRCCNSVKDVLSVCLCGAEDFSTKYQCVENFFYLYKCGGFSDHYGNALESFLSPIFEGDLRDSYMEIVDEFISDYFSQIKNGSFDQENLPVLKEMLKGCFEIEYHSCVYLGGTMQFRQGFFNWNEISSNLKWTKEIQNLLETVDVEPLVSDLLIESYGHLFGGLLRYPKASSTEAQEIECFLIENLKWCASFISTGYGLQPQKRNKLRDVIWNWILEYSKESNLVKYAEECEQTYCVLETDKEILEFINADYRDNHDELAEGLVHRRLIGQTSSDVIDFIERLEFYDYQEDYKIRLIACKYGKQIGSENELVALTSKIAKFCKKNAYKEFYFGLLAGYLFERNKFPQIVDLLKVLMKQGLDADEFLYRTISDSSIYSIQSYELLKVCIKEKNCSKYANIIASFVLNLNQSFLKFVEDDWNEWSDSNRSLFLNRLIENILVSERKWNNTTFEWNESSANWLVDKIALIEDLNVFDHSTHYFEEKASLFKEVKNIQWLCEIFEKRQHLGLNLSHDFSLTYFVRSDFNVEEQNAFIKIIEMLLNENAPYRFEEEIVKIDPENRCLSRIVVEKFNCAKTDDERKCFASIAGYLRDESPAWMDISAVVCRYTRKLTKEEKRRFWSMLTWKGIETYTCALGQVPQKHYDEVEHFRKMLSEETLPERREFWQIQLEGAESYLEFEEQRAKALRGE